MWQNILFTIIEKIVSGAAYKAWLAYKLNEVDHVQEKDDSLSDTDVANRLRNEFTRK